MKWSSFNDSRHFQELIFVINDYLEEMAKTIYDYWFVQFDFPDDTGKPYKTSGGRMIWNAEFRNYIPETWSVARLSDISKIECQSVIPNQMNVGSVEHYSIPAFDAEHFPVFESPKAIESNKYKVFKDSVLVSKLNPQFKRVWIPNCLTDIPLCSTEFLVLRPTDRGMYTFLVGVLKSNGFYQHMVAKAISSTGSRKRIQPDVAISYSFIQPSTKVIKAFTDKIAPIISMQQSIQYENYQLKTIRDWLLPMLMNGQATIEE